MAALFILQIDFQNLLIVQSVLVGVAAYRARVAGEVSSDLLHVPLLMCEHVASSALIWCGPSFGKF